jgi:hypothetical protein
LSPAAGLVTAVHVRVPAGPRRWTSGASSRGRRAPPRDQGGGRRDGAHRRGRVVRARREPFRTRQLGVGIEGQPGCEHERSFVRAGMRKDESWRRRWVSDDDVDVQSAWTPPQGAVATSTALGVLRSSPRLGRVTAANHHGVEEGVLRDASDRARLEDRRHGARPKDLDGESKVCQAIAEVAAQGRHGAHGRATVTATSRKDSGMGADGLCTVTSARMTLASWRHPSASRSASVSIRATGGPATVAASRCASCP